MTSSDRDLTVKETRKHIHTVAEYLTDVMYELSERSFKHDKTKLEEFELNGFSSFTSKLKDSVYGSDEYKKILKDLEPILDHHYKNNDHHPEHFDNGILDMNLMQITEMLCDWKAATLRHKDGNIYSSIEYNQKRFGYTDEFKEILTNTCKSLGW